MSNPFVTLLNLLPSRPLQVGNVASVTEGGVILRMPDGALMRARGSASVGQNVFVRDGVIEGEAPALTVVEIEI
jgi:hypothetical protein